MAIHRELSDAVSMKEKVEEERNDVVIENCFLKRRLARDSEELERLEGEIVDMKIQLNRAV